MNGTFIAAPHLRRVGSSPPRNRKEAVVLTGVREASGLTRVCDNARGVSFSMYGCALCRRKCSDRSFASRMAIADISLALAGSDVDEALAEIECLRELIVE